MRVVVTAKTDWDFPDSIALDCRILAFGNVDPHCSTAFLLLASVIINTWDDVLIVTRPNIIILNIFEEVELYSFSRHWIPPFDPVARIAKG